MLYREAMAFIFPSIYEGFGLPILEAFQNDCPVILSNSNCFKEIASTAAEYFDPNDENSILDVVTKVIVLTNTPCRDFGPRLSMLLPIRFLFCLNGLILNKASWRPREQALSKQISSVARCLLPRLARHLQPRRKFQLPLLK